MLKSRRDVLIILVLITLNFAAFLPSMSGGFLWDDRLLITENPLLLGPDFLKSFLVSPFGGFLGKDENSMRLEKANQFYRPLSSLSYWIDFKIWGLNPAAFHLTNILIHITNVILLFLILLNLGLNRLASSVGAVLFSVFPLHFENVSWISGRTDLLSFLFVGISVLFFVRFLKRNRWAPLLFSTFFYFLSLLAKENAIFLPAIYFLILYMRKSRLREWLLPMVPFAAGFGFWFVLRAIVLSSTVFQSSGRSVFDFLASLGFYVFKTLLPFRLVFTVDSGTVFQNLFFLSAGILSMMLFVFSLIRLIMKKRAFEHESLIVSAFFLSLLPAVIIIFSQATVSLLAWRFLYLSSAVVMYYLAYFLVTRIKAKRIGLGILICICLLYGAEIYPKNRAFGQSEKDFWLNMKNPEKENILARYNIGLHTLSQDEEKALLIFREILSLRDHPLHSRFEERIFEELAAYYTFRKDLEKAEEYFNRLLRMRPSQSQHFYVTYASFLAQSGRIEEGKKIIADMLRLFPENHLVLLHAAKFYIVLEDYPRAIELLNRDYKLFPTEEIRTLLKKIGDVLQRDTLPPVPPPGP